MRAVLTISVASLRRFVRSKENLFFTFAFPTLLILFFGLQFGSGVSSTVAIAGLDTPVGAAVAEALAASSIGVEGVADVTEATDWVERNWATVGLVIPDVDPAAEGAPVVDVGVLLGPSGMAQSIVTVVQSAVSDVSLSPIAVRTLTDAGWEFSAAAEAVDAAEVPRTAVETEVVGEALFSDDMGQFDLGASSQLVLFTFLTSLSSSGYLILSRRLGVSARMLATPTRVSAIVVGETLGRFLIALVQALFIVVVTALAFRVDWGNIGAALVLVAAFALVSTGAGMLLGSVVNSDQLAGGLGVMFGLILAALGGAMVPQELFPPTMQAVARFTPHHWALSGFRSLLFEGGGFADILTELAVLGGIAVVLIGGAMIAFRRSIVDR